jgi:Fic-DOC domain mobile mystery protein B
MSEVAQFSVSLDSQSWRWAGQYRSSDKSIGADWRQIRMQVPALLADIAFQVEHQVDPVDQIAIRFHHRLVSIHPFPNGNGRHARLIADVFVEQLGAPRFSWGGTSSLVDASALRQQYIAALQQADRGDLGALLAFARTS